MSNRKFNKKRIKKGMLAGVLALSVVISSTGSIVVNKTNTEAKRKKRNTKPKLILKGALKNKSVEIEEGETIKVNAVAKDKEDGNITKKVKIKVRNPENGEYEKRGKTITFINDGTYKITVSVKDSKKAKASATRTIIVKENTENYGLATDRPVITNAPRPTSVVSIKPNITNTPTVTKNPTETPKETRQPSFSETPRVSAIPSSMPEESVMPIITENPAESPKETSQPSISETPKVSAVPSFMPEESLSPDIKSTKEPVNTVMPIQSDKPVETIRPDNTPMPTSSPIDFENDSEYKKYGRFITKYMSIKDDYGSYGHELHQYNVLEDPKEDFFEKYLSEEKIDDESCLMQSAEFSDFKIYEAQLINDSIIGHDYLPIYGAVKAIDKYGVDISSNVFFVHKMIETDDYQDSKAISYVCAINSKNELICIHHAYIYKYPEPVTKFIDWNCECVYYNVLGLPGPAVKDYYFTLKDKSLTLKNE